MPPSKSDLPEGTDHIVRGASAEDEADTGSFAATKDKLVGQAREQISSLRSQATDRARGFADDGKARATSLLDDFSEVIDEAAQAVERKFGADYSDYAHRASGAVSGFADRVRAKTVDDLIDDTRDFVRKSPGIAIGIAAVAGFLLVRLIKNGLDDVSGGREAANDGA
ncbi:MAG TPA: hypothetical protein VMG08_17120 [Allosphingosinicella sp.]|nr:hypothetical protein [Allosphingosinicella sp.]